MNNKQQLHELVRYIVKQTLNEMLDSSLSHTFSKEPEDIESGNSLSQMPTDLMTPVEKANHEKEVKNQEDINLKTKKQSIKFNKTEQDLQKQKLNQLKSQGQTLKRN